MPPIPPAKHVPADDHNPDDKIVDDPVNADALQNLVIRRGSGELPDTVSKTRIMIHNITKKYIFSIYHTR